MEIIRKQTDYAFRALVELSENNHFCSAKQIAKDNDVPLDFLYKVLNTLEDKKIIKVKRGPLGGFSLAKKPEQIRLKDVIEVLQGPLIISDCLIGEKVCSQKTCGLQKEWQSIQKELIALFKSKTLKDITT